MRPRSEWPRETVAIERALELLARQTGTTVLQLAIADIESSDSPIRCGQLGEIIAAQHAELEQEREHDAEQRRQGEERADLELDA